MVVTRSFLIWGAGGHGKVVSDLIHSIGDEVAGFIDRDPSAVSRQISKQGHRVLLSEADFMGSVGRKESLPAGAVVLALGVGDNATRVQMMESVGDHLFPPLVHSKAFVSQSAGLGAGTVVMAMAVINAGAALEEAVIINTGSLVEHDCVIASGAHISPGAVLAGGVRIGRRTWVGASSVVIESVRIGDDCIIGAGAVVLRDVPDGATVVGNPAKQIKGLRETPNR